MERFGYDSDTRQIVPLTVSQEDDELAQMIKAGFQDDDDYSIEEEEEATGPTMEFVIECMLDLDGGEPADEFRGDISNASLATGTSRVTAKINEIKTNNGEEDSPDAKTRVKQADE